MEEKRIIQEEESKEIYDSDVVLEQEEENQGIGYEIGFSLTKS